MLLIILGEDEIQSHMEALHSLISDPFMNALNPCPEILTDLQSLLICHVTGMRLVSEFTRVGSGWQFEMDEFMVIIGTNTFPYDFHTARERFVPFLL